MQQEKTHTANEPYAYPIYHKKATLRIISLITWYRENDIQLSSRTCYFVNCFRFCSCQQCQIQQVCSGIFILDNAAYCCSCKFTRNCMLNKVTCFSTDHIMCLSLIYCSSAVLLMSPCVLFDLVSMDRCNIASNGSHNMQCYFNTSSIFLFRHTFYTAY